MHLSVILMLSLLNRYLCNTCFNILRYHIAKKRKKKIQDFLISLSIV